MTNCQNTSRDPQGKMVEIDGILYQIIDGKLYRYADLTLDKGFKIVLGRPGSEEILKNFLNRLLGVGIVHLEYRSSEYPGMTEQYRIRLWRNTAGRRKSLRGTGTTIFNHCMSSVF